MGDVGGDLCVSVVISLSQRALRYGKIVGIRVGGKRFLLQFEITNAFSVDVSQDIERADKGIESKLNSMKGDLTFQN